MGHNVKAQARLVGDLKISLQQLNKRITGKIQCKEWLAKLKTIS